jgi:hypothetical protein
MTRTVFLWVWIAAAAVPGSAGADGGELRYSGEKGYYRVAIFTAPVPARAGPVDVSVLVQDAATGQARPDVPVTVTVYPAGRTCCRERCAATGEAATNKLFRAATLELTAPGRWQVEVEVGEPALAGSVCFEVEVAAPMPAWAQLVPWVGWPFAALALVGLHQWLVRRRQAAVARVPANRAPG